METLKEYMNRRNAAFNEFMNKKLIELNISEKEFAENSKLQEDIAAEFDNDIWQENYYE